MGAEAVLATLADPRRLKVLGAIALGASTVAELGPGAEPHLARLVSAGLVERGAGGLQIRGAAFSEALASLAQPVPGDLPDGLPAGVFDGARIREVPRNPAHRALLLEWLAARFEPGREYTEPEVNAVLGERHADHVALRRYLVDAGLLRRTGDGRGYWRK